jgi:dipeptide/tripeptide permease
MRMRERERENFVLELRSLLLYVGNEACERLAYYGINTNLVVYLTTKLHQANAAASVNVTNWSGTCYITPLIGAFLADAYLGRYWTIATFSSIYFAVRKARTQKLLSCF